MAHFNSEAAVVDSHCDTLLKLLDESYSLKKRNDTGHLDIPRLKEGGVNIQYFAAFIEPQYKPYLGIQRGFQLADLLLGTLDKHPDDLYLIRYWEDIDRVLADDKIGVIFSMEGGEPLGDDLSFLRNFARLGLRSVCLTWNQRNQLADGVGEGPYAGGLSRFGREVVKEMNRLGIVVDVSHLAEAGFWDVVETSTAPVIASHSNARAVCDHPRNLTDDQLKALAKTGGLAGLNFCPHFLTRRDDAEVADLVKHFNHIVSVVGYDHVGLGTDYDGIGTTPEGLGDVSRLPVLTDALFAEGHSEEDIRKFLGENHLRVLRRVLPSEAG